MVYFFNIIYYYNMWVWNNTIRLYYALKYYFDYYFKNKDQLGIIEPNISDENKKKIEDMEDELIDLYEQIDIKYIYNCLNVLTKELNENTQINKVLDFLEHEAQFILQNKDNLDISLNKIKENTYVLELIGKFKLLDEIHEKEKELTLFKKSI